MMKKHRLGRIQTPWTNIESPIRSSSYKERIQQAKKQSATAQCHKKRQSISIAAKAILPPKLCTSDTKKPDPDHEMLSPTIFDIDAEKLSSPCEIEDDSEVTTSERTSHAIAFEKKEIADGLREWPALDMETQQSITREYQALHEEIKARGLYKCNYSNYAIESIRYAILFGTFLYFLRKEWYITSAVFLGFFWVRLRSVMRQSAI
jgi:delta8-fatty-acid desaturase